MKVTEDRAKTKFCPMVGSSKLTCLGSECMMWEWSEVKDQNYSGMCRDMVATGKMLDCLECKGIGKDGDGYQCMECGGLGKHPEFVQLGYCGLARAIR